MTARVMIGKAVLAGFVLAISAATASAEQDAAKPQPAPAAAPAAAAQAPSTAPSAAAPTAAIQKSDSSGGWQVEKDPSGITLDENQAAVVKLVSGYFGTLKSLKGAFVQTSSDNKRLKGKFFVKRPGRFRFDYALPSKQIIVSDGENLAIQDLDLRIEDRIALDQTPFRLILRKDVDLLRDAKITEVQQADDLIVLALSDKNPDTPGKIRLFLTTKPSLELKEWVTTDAQGVDTHVEVSELVNGDDLDGNLFKIQSVGSRLSTP